MSSGDILSQRIFERNEKHDFARSGRFAAYGFIFHAPVLAQWFKFVDKIKFKSKASALGSKVLLDQTIWGPWSVSMFLSVMSLMEGKTVHEAIERVQVGFWPIYLSGGVLFIPTAFLTYSIIPLAHRGLFLQGVGLGWNTYLSYANHAVGDRVVDIEAQHPEPHSSLRPHEHPHPTIIHPSTLMNNPFSLSAPSTPSPPSQTPLAKLD
ncbi:Peroxisomal membrane protein MPV17 and related proteins [Phaffia rhodozyma]|uniref:Peroxisomal membrane protein MPV17 and related proteins n=1 Tax=Phaffia rhodozyma TaxID=264483 RepID=A0A0F7SKW3_PHARH|nr:Peroxisomal membrane protein MPV17 and related proteins [Phaffia rhodozyma]